MRKSNTLIALILICLITILYSYFFNVPVRPDDLIKITGTLSKEPVLRESGGETSQYFIEFEINEDDKLYCLQDCAYEICDKKKILDLKKITS